MTTERQIQETVEKHRSVTCAIVSVGAWSPGASQVFEFLTDRWLFVPRGGPTWTPEQYHLGMMLNLSGDEFDLDYVRQSKYFDRYFASDGEPS